MTLVPSLELFGNSRRSRLNRHHDFREWRVPATLAPSSAVRDFSGPRALRMLSAGFDRHGIVLSARLRRPGLSEHSFPSRGFLARRTAALEPAQQLRPAVPRPV